MRDDDGGPAFPHPEIHDQHEPFRHLVAAQGMSLRDYFAATALQGLCASGGPYQPNDYNGWGIVNCEHKDVAREAYKLADAMLAAKEST